jgi:glycosyltransferase involved in cell wall biosynthesis
MKILIALHDLSQVGGTQTWAMTMGEELAKEHEVEIWCLVGGAFGEVIRLETGVPVIGGDQKVPHANDYDLMLVCQNAPMRVLAPMNGFKIYTQHGPTHPAEYYPGGADKVVAVSNETKDVLRSRGYDSTVIWNGINLDKFKPHDPKLPNLTADFLVACKGRRGMEMAINACQEGGYSFHIANYKASPTFAMWDLIPYCRSVISFGRGILEGIACGKPVFCFDARGDQEPRGDGWIDEDTANECIHFTGFNGRTQNVVSKISHHYLERVKTIRADWQRDWAEDNIDVKDKVRDYLALVPKGVEHG